MSQARSILEQESPLKVGCSDFYFESTIILCQVTYCPISNLLISFIFVIHEVAIPTQHLSISLHSYTRLISHCQSVDHADGILTKKAVQMVSMPLPTYLQQITCKPFWLISANLSPPLPSFVWTLFNIIYISVIEGMDSSSSSPDLSFANHHIEIMKCPPLPAGILSQLNTGLFEQRCKTSRIFLPVFRCVHANHVTVWPSIGPLVGCYFWNRGNWVEMA